MDRVVAIIAITEKPISKLNWKLVHQIASQHTGMATPNNYFG
ncbi:hypothetical protein [Candidatus Nitrosoglobus terrae]|nr:hypothetical protein [Candidatus Nitrosoglobus terrae]